jgi:hypothetical protein
MANSLHIARGDHHTAGPDGEQEITAPLLLDPSLFGPGTQVEFACGIVVTNNGSNVALTFRLRQGGTEVPATGTLLASGSISTNGLLAVTGTFVMGDLPEFFKLSVFRAPSTVGNQQIYSNVLFVWESPVDEPIEPVETDGPPAAPDFGTDIDVLDDLPDNLTLVSGVRNYLQAIARRFDADEGVLRDLTEDEAASAPDYGLNIRRMLNANPTLEQVDGMARLMERQALLDPRTLGATVEATYDLAESALTATLLLETSAGPFTLVLKIDALTVAILAMDSA